uniref:Uncharacterized protein n=1 Tax=Otus sunia TaxID=257818 RepID=A0A8C8BK71_9STRI
SLSLCLHDFIYPPKKRKERPDICFKSNFFTKSAFWSCYFVMYMPQRQSFCVDTTKKLCSNQAADVSELQVSCQNDLVHRENKKDMTGKATLVETIFRNRRVEKMHFPFALG